MATFKFGVQAGLTDDATFGAALGVNPAGKLTDRDLYKAVKLSGDSTYSLCADGDEIEGILVAVEPSTVNAGYGFGTVQKKERVLARNMGAAIAVGAYVVAAAQPAVGTAIGAESTGQSTGAQPTPVKSGTPATYKWRVVSLITSGATGGIILIERQ